MANQVLVIVESPTKAKTIKKFLPKNFQVVASVGHVRDLPQSASDIPKKLKEEEWTKLGVNIENDFEPLYVVPKDKTKVIKDLKTRMKEADELYLATDEDREGESIAWHLLELLQPKIPVKRMVFHEITKKAIEQALKETRDIDTRLVRAQETRRILDRLVGYTLSPLLWKKIAYGLSAGRVQSVALRLLIERERERYRFQKASYWDLAGEFKKGSENFEAKLLSYQGKRIAQGKDFDETTGKVDPKKDVVVLGEKEAKNLVKDLEKENFKVLEVEEKPTTARPYAPFITSTLQQEANRKLGLSARDAMRTAQRLYEEGLITYMRTDSPNLSSQAIQAARSIIEDLYGKEYLSETPRQYTSKNKGAQEAHEAIRPSGETFAHPKETGLSGKEYQLYELIWKRTVACQMAEAKKLSVSVKMEAKNTIFQANGSRILFPGFLRAYVEGSDDPDAALEDREVLLPKLEKGDSVSPKELKANAHETKPRARYTEASLVQMMEKEGIGRPSTYASVISTLLDRDYAKRVGQALIPTFTGFGVIQLLEKHFEELVDLGFTSEMEQSLDEIAEGKKDWLPYLNEFFKGSKGLLKQVEGKEKKIDANESRTIHLHQIPGVEIKIGRYGAYLIQEDPDASKDKKKKKSDDDVHATIPEDTPPADLTKEKIDELIQISKEGPKPIAKHPENGQDIFLLTGRYGPYFQLGEKTEENPTPRRASVPTGKDGKTMSIEEIVQALSLPKALGVHPESKKEIMVNIGRFGPYIMHDGEFRSIPKTDSVYTIKLDRALEILATEKKGRGGAKLVREIGKHPDDQKAIGIYDGKYGMYIKYKSTNVTLPKEEDPEKITLEKALELIAERKKQKKKKK